MSFTFAALKPGDTVAVVSPSGWVAPEVLETGAKEIAAQGYVPFIHPQCGARLRKSSFAGDAAARLAALHEVYKDDKVKAILCARGGYGAPLLVQGLDFELIARHPKPFIGYSDQTVIVNAIAARCGQPAFLGPMLWSLHNLPQRESWNHLWRALRGEAVLPSTAGAEVLVSGQAKGPLVGGNLSLLSTRMGTPTQPRFEGSVLVLEDVGETLYKLERMLVHLRDAGVFDQINGLILGELVKCADETDGFKLDETVPEFLQRWFGGFKIPVITNMPCGHGAQHTLLPVGAEVTLTANAAEISLAHKPLFA